MEGEDRQDYQPQAKYQPKSFSLSRTLTNFPQPQLLFQLINNISTSIRFHKCFLNGSKIISIRIKLNIHIKNTFNQISHIVAKTENSSFRTTLGYTDKILEFHLHEAKLFKSLSLIFCKNLFNINNSKGVSLYLFLCYSWSYGFLFVILHIQYIIKK